MTSHYQTTVNLGNEKGPKAIVVQVPGNGNGRRIIEAWMGKLGESNVYVFSGNLSLEQCEKAIAAEGVIDCIACLGSHRTPPVAIDDDTKQLTLFFESENKSGHNQSVTVKITEC